MAAFLDQLCQEALASNLLLPAECLALLEMFGCSTVERFTQMPDFQLQLITARQPTDVFHWLCEARKSLSTAGLSLAVSVL